MGLSFILKGGRRGRKGGALELFCCLYGSQRLPNKLPLLLPRRLEVNICRGVPYKRGGIAEYLVMGLQEFRQSLTPQDALLAMMVGISASDNDLRTSELVAIQRILHHMPAFIGYDHTRLEKVTGMVLDLFADEDGLDEFFSLVRNALPERLYETAYALACDVAAANGTLYQPVLQLLREIRDELSIDPLHAAAIERGARARHLRVE